MEYVPGDLTSFKDQHPSREFLLEEKFKRDHNIESDLELNKNYLGDHECKLDEPCEPPPIKLTPLLPHTSTLTTSNPSPRIGEFDLTEKYSDKDNFLSTKQQDTTNMFGSQRITEKPNERSPSPIVPAYANFELAKRMHSNNLDHQPLPDCVADLAFRKLQITGANPGLALDIEPIATGVGVKTHNAGPTHCTKMKIYRPKTSGVVPRPYNGNDTRSYSATPVNKKMGAMDLAICWDYKPIQEPPIPRHIDGSNDSAGPAVFTYVKSPREDATTDIGRSAGVFTNTLGETGFFDKDILRRKTDFSGRKLTTDDFAADLDLRPTYPRVRSVSRDNSACHRLTDRRLSKQYKSTPDMLADHEYKALREKYLGPDCAEYPGSATGDTGCKTSGFLRRARSRLCHKIAPEINCCPSTRPPNRMTCKAAFRVGIPRYNAAGNFISSDSGCSMDSHHSQKVLVVPRPRNPYSKRNYDIDTLVPPFRSYGGGAGEGGYPEHWRLASVYQHAYKPLECRRKPLLQTVFK